MMKKRCLLLCLLLLLSGCTQQSVEKMPEELPVTVGESTPGAPMPENEAQLPAFSADLEELNRVHTPALYAMGGYGSWDDPTVMRPVPVSAQRAAGAGGRCRHLHRRG